MEKFLENFYGVLFCPDQTFDRLKENPPLFQGFLIVLLISVMSPLLNFDAYSGLPGVVWLGIKMFGAIVFGVISWIVFALFIDYLSAIFGKPNHTKVFLTLFAFALTPWIFIAPLELLKTGGILGSIPSIFLGLAVWLWVLILIIKAIIKAYNFSFGRTLALLFVPFIGGLLAIYWITGFFSTLIRIIQV